MIGKDLMNSPSSQSEYVAEEHLANLHPRSTRLSLPRHTISPFTHASRTSHFGNEEQENDDAFLPAGNSCLMGSIRRSPQSAVSITGKIPSTPLHRALHRGKYTEHYKLLLDAFLGEENQVSSSGLYVPRKVREA